MSDDRHPTEPCPRCGNAHGVDESCLSAVAAVLDEKVAGYWKSLTTDTETTTPELTYETLCAAIAEIEAGPRVPEVEVRGDVVYLDGVPTYRLNRPLLTRPIDWAEPARSFLFPRPTVFMKDGVRDAAREEVARQLDERRQSLARHQPY